MSSAVATVAMQLENERLTALGQKFRLWQRREGKSIFKMPSYLWDEAIGFVERGFGLRSVARELGVDREELKRRMDEAQRPACPVAALPASVAAPGAPEADVDVKPMQFLDLEIDCPGDGWPPAASEPHAAEPDSVVAPAPEPVLVQPALLPESAPAEHRAPIDAPPRGASAPASAEEAYLEVVAADGAKLSIRIPVHHVMNVCALVREFRSSR